ncbi:unnamed protein product [Debaryomyces tyrocola]|nr:unnamed protein product [Debaryomyces tyrocola]
MSYQDPIITKKSKEEKSDLAFDDEPPGDYIQNAFSSMFKYIFIIAGSLINSVAKCLIINVIVLFGVRDRVKKSIDDVLNIQLSIIEVIIFGNIFLFRLLCKITGTRMKKPDGSDDKYDTRGYLRYSEIHRQYWSHMDITYKDDENAYSVSTNVKPITKFFDITNDKALPGNNIRQDRPFEPNINNENGENELSTTDGEVHKRYFSFYRKQKKVGDSQSLAS